MNQDTKFSLNAIRDIAKYGAQSALINKQFTLGYLFIMIQEEVDKVIVNANKETY